MAVKNRIKKTDCNAVYTESQSAISAIDNKLSYIFIPPSTWIT